jgi:hypothetical protein
MREQARLTGCISFWLLFSARPGICQRAKCSRAGASGHDALKFALLMRRALRLVVMNCERYARRHLRQNALSDACGWPQFL